MLNHDELYSEANALHQAGQLDPAVEKYRQLLQENPENAAAWCRLGQIYLMQEQPEEAQEAFEQSLDLDPSSVVACYFLGLALEKTGYLQQAIQAYTDAITQNLAHTSIQNTSQSTEQKQAILSAYNQRGGLFLELGDLDSAMLDYQTAIQLDSTESVSYLNLGNLHLSCLQLQNYRTETEGISNAIKTYQRGLSLNPNHPDLLYQLGIAFTVDQDELQANFSLGSAAYYRGQYSVAIEHYRRTLDRKILATCLATREVYSNLADCYEKLEQYDLAIQVYQAGLEHYPEAIELYECWILGLQSRGNIQAATAVAEQAIQKFPDNISLQLINQRLLPVLYETVEEIRFYRNRFSQRLEALLKRFKINPEKFSRDILRADLTGTNFYLQYQGENDLKLQQRYSELIQQAVKTEYFTWTKPLLNPQKHPDQKIKVGYISAFLNFHTVGLVFLGWVREVNHQDFEVYCYHLDSERDIITDLFQLYSDHFSRLCRDSATENLTKIAEKIRRDQLDILVFLDIGMFPLATQLACLRLAPVQCTAWGHPVTTGLSSIDYYLSADLLELPIEVGWVEAMKPNAGSFDDGAFHFANDILQGTESNIENPDKCWISGIKTNRQDSEYYSEKLIRLPNLGIHYTKPQVPILEKNRLDFGLKSNSVIYLSCQSLFKYLPQYDRIFVEIAQAVPNAQFVFIAHWITPVTEKFRQRLHQGFLDSGLNSEDHVVILPRLDKQDYLQLHLLADIGLDTIGFTGFLTTLDGLACNLPIVTHTGELMRSRQSTGIFHRIGVVETVATTLEQYVKIAVRLGLEPDWRGGISRKIQSQQALLYEDKSCIQALEAFYRSVV